MVLQNLLGNHYTLQSTTFDVHQLGWPMHRRRRWTVLCHKVKCKDVSVSLEEFVSIFFRQCAHVVARLCSGLFAGAPSGRGMGCCQANRGVTLTCTCVWTV